jgi:hypothetical protein
MERHLQYRIDEFDRTGVRERADRLAVELRL